MRPAPILALTLALALTLLAPLLASPAQGAPDSRVVIQASEILAKIENGEPVEYDGVIVEGDLDLSGLDLPTEHVERTELEIKYLHLSEEAKVVKSSISITNSEIRGNTNFNNAIFREQVNFENTKFTGDAGFLRSNFSGYANFREAQFSGGAAYFGEAQFSGGAAYFGEAQFSGGDAYFGEAQFSGGDAYFGEAQFSGGDANFLGANFSGDADFERAQFSSDVDFTGAQVRGDANFSGAQVIGYANFMGAQFSRYVDFFREKILASEILGNIKPGEPIEYNSVIIEGDLDLSQRTLKTVRFNNTVFWGSVTFEGTNFTEDAWFQGANFGGGDANFGGANFNGGDANFGGANFSGGDAYFVEAEFGNNADFKKANFSGGAAYFWGANFSSGADFGEANFSSGADFGEANFSGNYAYFATQLSSNEWQIYSGAADFSGANFSSGADFYGAQFSGDAHFTGANFNGDADFWEAVFSGDAHFTGANFSGGAHFYGAQFSGSYANFWRANFSGGYADFGYAVFSEDVYFEDSSFYHTNLTLEDAKNIRVLRLSDATFENKSTICLNETDYERLYVHWDQIKDGFVYNGEAYLTLIKNFRNIEYFEDADVCYYQYRRERQAMRSWGETAKYTDILGWVTCGYGVRVRNTLALGLAVVFVCAVYYWRKDAIRRLKGDENEKAGFWDAFYFSMMTFTTVGYGDWYPLDKHRRWVMIEGILGWLLLSLFLVTLANVIIR